MTATIVVSATGHADSSRNGDTHDLLGKLLTRSDANTALNESFVYDTLNRLTSATVALSPTPLIKTFAPAFAGAGSATPSAT